MVLAHHRLRRRTARVIGELEGGWPERVLPMQRNWIGRSEGAEIDFTLEGTGEPIRVFTTRVDTIYGATCVILAPEHPLVAEAASTRSEGASEADDRCARRQRVRAISRRKACSPDSYAVNPFSGEKVPIWIGNFVLMDYGTGAIMAVPAHDERDFEFCKQYGIPIRPVIRPVDGALADAATMKEAFADDGIVENSGEYSGLPSAEARRVMTAKPKRRASAKAAITFRIKDWGISRQRYWGTPIPVIHCPKCGMVPVPESDLPVVLPLKVPITGKGRSPLENVPEFVNVKCPKCGEPARRETDTMDTFVDSSWYFYRYCDPHNRRAPFDSDEDRLLVSDRSIHRRRGARDSAPDLFALLHQGDARYRADRERRAGQAPVHARHGDQGRREDVEIEGQRGERRRDDRALRRRYGPPVRAVRRAAGKEKWTGPTPARTARTVSSAACIASSRGTSDRAARSRPPPIRRRCASCIRRCKQITDDFEGRWHFNTSIAALMELMNVLTDLEKDLSAPVIAEVLEKLTLMLEPFAPYLAEELWEEQGREGPVFHQAWPEYDPELAREEEAEVVIQVNGKVRGRINVAFGTPREALEKAGARRHQGPAVAGRQAGGESDRGSG